MFPKLQTESQELNRIQDNIIREFSELNIPLIKGNLIEEISFTGSQTLQVAHKLGKKYTGYFIIKKNANQQFFDNDIPDENFVTLTSSGTCKISLWVF